MKKILFIIITLITGNLLSCAQSKKINKPNNMNNPKIKQQGYIIGEYMVDPPVSKTISTLQPFVEYFGKGGAHGFGLRYAPCEKYNYNTTTLYIMGEQVMFKEDLVERFENVDSESIRLLYSTDNNIIFTDNKSLYNIAQTIDLMESNK